MREYKKTITFKIIRKVMNADGEIAIYEYEYEKPNPKYKSEEQQIQELNNKVQAAKEYYFLNNPKLNDSNFRYCKEAKLFADIDGNIYSLNIKKGILNKNPTNHGYITNNGFAAHQIVLLAFDKYEEGKEVDHINNDRTDNRLCNLRMLTHAENMRKQIEDNGGIHHNKGVCGKDHVRSKPVLQCDLTGKLIKEWESQNLAALNLGIDQSQISACANMNKTRTSKFITAHGYIWKNKES